MSATMTVFCLIETKFNDSKSGTEFGDAVFRMGPQFYEKFKWKVFYNTRKGPHSKQCQYVWKIYIHQSRRCRNNCC